MEIINFDEEPKISEKDERDEEDQEEEEDPRDNEKGESKKEEGYELDESTPMETLSPKKKTLVPLSQRDKAKRLTLGTLCEGMAVFSFIKY
jgi:hypothetical protein